LLTISKDGKVMDVNKAVELVTGISREALIGSDFSDHFTESERARMGYRHVFHNGFVRDYPLAIRHVSGRITDVLFNATLYRNDAGEIQGVFAAARDVTDRKRMDETLRESENRLRFLSSELLNVQESERKRIALEIHDSLGQSLNAIKFRVESALQELKGTSDQAIVRSIRDIIPVIQESIDDARRLQMDLRPPMLDDLGIIATLSWFGRQFQSVYTDIKVDIQTDIAEDAVPKPLKIQIYRILQEAMNNIIRHAGATQIQVRFHKNENHVELEIEDNGIGFTPPPEWMDLARRGHLGLVGMRERVEMIGGQMDIQSESGRGTVVRVSAPLSCSQPTSDSN